MPIEPIGSDQVRPGAGRPAGRPGTPQPVGPVTRVGQAQPQDRVDLSDEGRALAAMQELLARLEAEVGEDRAAEILRRIRDGTYDSFATAEVIARRLLSQGDV